MELMPRKNSISYSFENTPSKETERAQKKRIDYYPFGLQHGKANAQVNSTNAGQQYKYNGVELEASTGLYEMDFRQYNPEIGRFTSIDPLAEEYPEWSPYVFATNNPVRFVDPTGLFPQDCPDCPKGNFFSTISGFFKGVFGGQQEAQQLAESGNTQAAQRIDAKIEGQVTNLESYADALSIVPGFSLAEGASKASEGDALGAATSLGMAALDLGTGGTASTAKTSAKAGVKAVAKGLPEGMTPNAGGKIVSFITNKAETYYRVSNNGGIGGFLTKVKPKSSTFAREGLALPAGNNASLIQEVIVPAGINVQRSRAIPAFGRRGGLEQFEVLNRSQRKLINYGKAKPFN